MKTAEQYYPWKDISSLPYDEIVIIMYESGHIKADFMYDEGLEDFIESRTQVIGFGADLLDKPKYWMSIPPLSSEQLK